MSSGHLWEDNTDKRKPQYSVQRLSRCYSVHYNPHTQWPGIKTSLRLSIWHGPAQNRNRYRPQHALVTHH